jgi:hypothetical protein
MSGSSSALCACSRSSKVPSSPIDESDWFASCRSLERGTDTDFVVD